MSTAFDYGTLVARNAGYVSPATQAAIADTTLLIAGCGIGSGLATCAARMGFRKFVLVDGDVIEAHNLNRQFYGQADIGGTKVEQLRQHILAINPEAEVEAVAANLDAGNVEALVGRADIIFDTVDFVDLPAILSLHGEARRQDKPLFTALNVGFGALVWFFPAGTRYGLVDMLAGHMESSEGGSPASYAAVFASFIQGLVPYLDAEVVSAIEMTLSEMSEGRACPAPQLSVGSFAVASLALTMIHDLLDGRPVIASPDLVIQSYRSMSTKVVSLLAAPAIAAE